MAKLVTLHDANGEVIYPQSVWDENMIPDNTVKSSMIDWSSMTDESSYFRLGNLLVQFGTYNFGAQSFSNDYWGSLRRSDRQNNHIVWPIKFAGDPYFVEICPGQDPQIGVSRSGGNQTQSLDFCTLAPTSFTGSSVVKGYWLAIGPAK